MRLCEKKERENLIQLALQEEEEEEKFNNYSKMPRWLYFVSLKKHLCLGLSGRVLFQTLIAYDIRFRFESGVI